MSYFLVPRQQVKNFFGREEQLDQITSYFKDEVERPRILVLHALGGQSKSQIALEYCQRAWKTYRGGDTSQRVGSLCGGSDSSWFTLFQRLIPGHREKL
jgi:hypothetical protein